MKTWGGEGWGWGGVLFDCVQKEHSVLFESSRCNTHAAISTNRLQQRHTSARSVARLA